MSTMTDVNRHLGASMVRTAPDSLSGAMFTSFSLHVAFVLIMAFGLPYFAHEVDITSTPISVSIVDIGEITQSPHIGKTPPKPEEKRPPKPTAMTANEPPKLSRPEPPKPIETPPMEAKAPEVKETVEEVTTPNPQLVAPEEVTKADESKIVKLEKPPTPVSKPKPPAPKVDKKEEAVVQKQFTNLLKNLAPDAAETNKTEKAADVEPASGLDTPNLGEKLTISEIDSLKSQITPCWAIPAGAKNAEDLAIDIRVTMNRDATVQSVKILDQGRYARDQHFRAAADSAQRALRNPRCQPLRLPMDKYETWKSILIRFDPREVL